MFHFGQETNSVADLGLEVLHQMASEMNVSKRQLYLNFAIAV